MTTTALTSADVRQQRPARLAQASDTTVASSSTSSVPAVPADARVAVIGDSHTYGAFGKHLQADLQKRLQQGGGKLVSFTGVPSSGVSNWLRGTDTQAGPQTFHTPTIDDVLKSKPKVLVVALGSNMLGNTPEGNRRQIEALLDKADKAGAKVVWVGPPNMRGFNGNLRGPQPEQRFYDALKSVNDKRAAQGKQPITIVDSRKSTREQDAVDGVHFQGGPAAAWEQDVFRRLT
ncbi:MAG TPA: SGNH/GDSL hydrolase family protein [Myxococcota bacterium]